MKIGVTMEDVFEGPSFVTVKSDTKNTVKLPELRSIIQIPTLNIMSLDGVPQGNNRFLSFCYKLSNLCAKREKRSIGLLHSALVIGLLQEQA
jgi:hypothetical protein